MHLDQTSHNMEGGAQPKENGNEWCMKKNEQMKKKLIRVALEFFKKCWVQKNYEWCKKKIPIIDALKSKYF